jgi:hypothetical protein
LALRLVVSFGMMIEGWRGVRDYYLILGEVKSVGG